MAVIDMHAWMETQVTEYEGGRPGSALERLREQAMAARDAFAELLAAIKEDAEAKADCSPGGYLERGEKYHRLMSARERLATAIRAVGGES